MNGEEGIDERLFTGAWSDWLTADMFVSPGPNGAVPSLEPYLQPMPEMFLDENYLISSELFNLTSKMTNIRLRLPAPVQADVKSYIICTFKSKIHHSLLKVLSAIQPLGVVGGVHNADSAITKLIAYEHALPVKNIGYFIPKVWITFRQTFIVSISWPKDVMVTFKRLQFLSCKTKALEPA